MVQINLLIGRQVASFYEGAVAWLDRALVAGEITAASRSSAQNATHQASSVAQTTATLEELSASFQSVADGARRVLDVAENALESAQGGLETVDRTHGSIDELATGAQDMADAAGVKVILDPTTKPWYFPNYPIIHVFRPKQQETLVSMLLQNAESRGAEVWWNTPGVRLLREGQGRVTGIIARDASGDYLQFNARRGVVLCTGDYGHNRQLVERFLPEITHDLRIVYEPDVNTGDGHLMGLWAGAAIDDAPHCPMLWDFAHFSDTGLFNLARQPWLYVNTNGERFMNEDLPYGYECNQMLQQPERHAWAVWDAKYDDEWPKMQSQCCKNMGPPTYLWNPRQLEEALEKGNVVTAPSIPELAARMNVPADAFQATVDRYNELARRHYDADFGKHPSRLTTLEKPLYYATIMQVRRMVILSGLKINPRMQVMDTGRMPIPGLYAAGNTSGGFFANAYPTAVPGLTHSRAWTFGRLAGQNAAAGI